MGNTFGKRTLAPGFHQEAARALGTTPGKTTRVQQELGAGLGGDAASVDGGGGDVAVAVPAVCAAAAHGIAGPAQVPLGAGAGSGHSAAAT